MVENVSKRYGPGCVACAENTGPGNNRNICPHCRSVWACQGISFDLYPGEVLGIVGESGSGKSTLLNLIYFDSETSSGTMRMHLNGRNPSAGLNIEEKDCFQLSAYTKRQMRNTHLGIVYQHPHMGLRMNISAGGNIAERLLMAGWRHVGRIRQRAGHLLTKTEVPLERMDDGPRLFSGGMQQRVQIAKALCNEPLLLLLDEVTTGSEVGPWSGGSDQ